jgi:hypothetical protein
MTRRQRSFHRILWPPLVIVVTIAFAMAFGLRPPAPDDQASAETVAGDAAR